MVCAMLEATTLQSSSSLQRWWQLFYLLTADVAEGERLLILVAEELRTVTRATACRITWDEPSAAAVLDVTSGTISRVMQKTVAEAIEAASRHRGPFITRYGGGTVLSFPLTRDARGWLQLIDADITLPEPDLQLVAVMLGNTLTRHETARQALRSHQQAISHYAAENERLAAALRIEQERLLRREVDVRTQIGRDLHDGPVQQVAVADLTVQYVRRVAERAPERLNEALDDLQDQLKRASRDLRIVLYELRPLGIVEEGLVSALQQYTTRITDQNGLQIRLEAPEEFPRLAADAESAVFIIMQEALNNVRKHAEATLVRLRLWVDAASLVAEVRDNGHGFDVERTQASYLQRGSYGLLNMGDRAELLGGTCTITSVPGVGTTVQVRVPLVR